MLFQTKVGEAWQVGNCSDDTEHIVWPRESILIQAVPFLCQPEVQGEPLPRGENKKAQENTFYKSVYKTSLRYLSSHLPSYLQSTFPWSWFAIKFWTSVSKKLSAWLLNTLKMWSILESIEWKQFRNTNASRFWSGRNKLVLRSVNWYKIPPPPYFSGV